MPVTESNKVTKPKTLTNPSRVDPANQYKLEGLIPKTVPFDHQVTAYNRFKDSEYFALFADMGTGKSKIAIDIGAYKYNTGQIEAMLIIAPNNVHLQWEREQFPLSIALFLTTPLFGNNPAGKIQGIE